VIDGVNFGAARRAAALDIFVALPGNVSGAAGLHQQIQLFGNTIRNTPESAIYVGASAHVVIDHNVIDHVSTAPRLTSGEAAIFVDHSSEITGSANMVTASPGSAVDQSNSSDVSIGVE
jgi:hypothetical protein